MKSKCRQNRILKDLYRELHKVGLPKTGKEKLWVLNENDEPKLYIHEKTTTLLSTLLSSVTEVAEIVFW